MNFPDGLSELVEVLVRLGFQPFAPECCEHVLDPPEGDYPCRGGTLQRPVPDLHAAGQNSSDEFDSVFIGHGPSPERALGLRRREGA